ncbi:MAG: ATP-binding cassette domain-containing protein [Bacteroidia bacterium]|nr:ATP-binding cassette domain-containing protein [Bacteroidia bacterium]
MQSPYAIETSNLNYYFSKQEQVLKNIQLHVPVGAIYGFLGPNGAGKTTTLRLLLGLLKKQSGSVKFFDKHFEEHRIDILKNTGSLIEAPSLYHHLTAVENLKVWQHIYQCPMARLNDVLQLVKLTHTANKKVSQFSLGMKQRLSIAIALMHQPRLLILDEPSNGLDPAGIAEMRDLLIQLNKQQGITILISSHLLSEIEKMVSHIGIIHHGAMVFEGTAQQLQLKQQAGSVVVFQTSQTQVALGVIEAFGCSAQLKEGRITVPQMENQKLAQLNKQLVEAGIDVFEISQQKNDLESIFIDLTKA